MKIVKKVALVVAPLGVALILGGETYDYGLQCTKCLLYRHITVQRCFGIPFYRSSTERTKETDYEGIFGQPCQHIFRTGGFGRQAWFVGSVGCGSTADGSFLRWRMKAVAMTYELAKRFGDKQTARDTFAIIDRLMPPDSRMSWNAKIPGELFDLCLYLERVGTREDWLDVLRCATNDFRQKPNLPDPYTHPTSN